MTTSTDAFPDSTGPGETHWVIFSNPETAKSVPVPDLDVAAIASRPPAFSNAY